MSSLSCCGRIVGILGRGIVRTTIAVSALCLVVAGAADAAPTTERVSVSTLGVEGNLDSNIPSISTDGRFVAFMSDASNLVAGDTNGAGDIFMHDLKFGTTERISLDSSGAEANGFSYFGTYGSSISEDGRYVVFQSNATNLIAGDTNGIDDVFVRDRSLGITERVSVDPIGGGTGGVEASISADGRYVVFSSLTIGGTGVLLIYRYDRTLDALQVASIDSSGGLPNGDSQRAKISRSGNLVAFESNATDLVVGDTNGTRDIFLRNLSTGANTRLSMNGATQSNGFCTNVQMSEDGGIVVFESSATNLVAGDTNGYSDIFAVDRSSGTITLKSRLGTSLGNLDSINPTIDPTGRYVAFKTEATNFDAADTNGISDVYIVTPFGPTPIRISLNAAGGQLTGGCCYSSNYGAMSADATYMAFATDDSGVVAGDTNGLIDIFVRGPH